MAKHDSSYYIKEARKGGCEIKPGAGDHIKVYKPSNRDLPPEFRNPLVVPYNLKGNGTESKIIKWLAALGIGLIILMIIAML